MPNPKNADKEKNVLKELEKTISPVLVVNNSSLKPFVELFEYAPENIYQQPLGSLVGFFEVKEYSEESAYVVNFLTSVLKKEYYINPKRDVTESLDSALHKVNLALSELAKQGNVQWLGKVNAAICVLEKNNAHFSVSGNAKIFLYRNQVLSEISEGLASELPEPHPLKTFVNVSSGRLEKGDRMLITSEDIFHILPILEIKKNFERHEGEKFVQFLKTALSNQMEMIASVVVDMFEPVPEPIAKKSAKKKVSKTTNVFSEKTFANSTPEEVLLEAEHLEEIEKEIEDSEYTDKKTGHIYIQGEANDGLQGANSQLHMYQDLAKEKISQGIYLAKNELRKRFSLYKKQLAKKKALRLEEKARLEQLRAEEEKRAEEQRVLDQIERQQKLAEQQELERIRIEEEKIAEKQRIKQEEIAQKERALQVQIEDEPIVVEEIFEEIVEKIPETETTSIDHFALSFKEKLQRAKIEEEQKQQQKQGAVIDLKKPQESSAIFEEDADEIDPFEEFEIDVQVEEQRPRLQKILSVAKISAKKSFVAITKLKNSLSKIAQEKWRKSRNGKEMHRGAESKLSVMPHFSVIKKLYSRFTGKQKLYTLGALALVFIVPLFIVHFLNKPKTPTITQLQVTPPTQSEILANEKNIHLQTSVQNVISAKGAIATLIANDAVALITKTSITLLQNGQPSEFQLPADSGAPVRATFMNDLSLIFLLTDSGKVISFSPVSKKFTDNKINADSFSKESFIGTYLTYLYVLDPSKNQILRFPRADGGFGDQTSWLKDSVSLSNVSDMTIDDNIFAISGNQILKFFKGKRIDFALEASATPVHFDKIFTTPDLQFFYVLDTQNSRLVQFAKDSGQITAQFFNESFSDGISLSVNEQTKTAFVATSSGLISISLQ